MQTEMICTGKFLTYIPKNVIFNKARTGCGGTTVALTNDENYVVCVPYINAIKGKMKASENKELYKHEVLGIYSDISGYFGSICASHLSLLGPVITVQNVPYDQ